MKNFGLGDLAYYLFRPAVYAIDFVWGTDLKDCDKCKARRSKWNKVWAGPWQHWAVIAAAVAACVVFF